MFLCRHDAYDALGCSEAIFYQVTLMVNCSLPMKGKRDYWKERKGVYIICVKRETLLAFTFDEQTENKRYGSTGNRTQGQDCFS